MNPSTSITPQGLREAYARGENIAQLLRQATGVSTNTSEIIEIAYDLQAGSYIASMSDPQKRNDAARYTSLVADEIRKLVEHPQSVLEAGVGEATTLSGVLKSLGHNPEAAYGFDLSWSRIAYAKKWLDQQGLAGVHLCTGSLFEIPYIDNAFDVVYTSHSIEPNGGNEIAILKELYRVTARYLLLLEPGFEIASEEGQKRMRMHGYCAGLEEKCRQLGFEVLETRRFEACANPLNPTMLLSVKKSDVPVSDKKSRYACPVFKTSLKKRGSAMASSAGMLVYPIIGGIPCLRTSNAVVASHFEKQLKA